MSDTPETALQTVTELPGPPADVRSSMSTALALFKHAAPALSRWLNEEATEHLQAAVLHSFRTTPQLSSCSPESIVAAIHTCGQLNLSPGPAGHIYLIPYGQSCQVIIGYKGMVQLAHRSGLVRDMVADVIYQCETNDPAFVFQKHPQKLVIPAVFGGDRSDDAIVAAYCQIRLTNGGEFLHVIDRQEIDARRARNKRSSKGPWKTDYARMARKSAIRSLFAGGTVPMSPQLELAIQLESIQAAPAPETPAPAASTSTALEQALQLDGRDA